MRFLFLDTMTFLHFRPLDEIDWLSLANESSVRLVVSQVTIRELNKLKDATGRKKIRERAGSALKKLGALVRQSDPPLIRPQVELCFRSTEPLIDFVAHKLTDKLADDWLIATMLEFRNELPESRLAIVTNDVGLQLKAVGHGFDCIELLDEYALPDEPDEDQKRVQALERELDTYKNIAPSLGLTFNDGKDHIQFRLARLPLKTDEVIRRRMEDVRVRHPKVQKPDGYSGADLMRGGVGPADIDRYNQQLDQYYEQFEKYLRGIDIAEDAQRRVIQLDITLLNNGFSPAKDIDIYLHFPDGLKMTEDLDEIIAFPNEPQAPEGPKSAIQIEMERLTKFRFGLNPSILQPDLAVGNAIGERTIFNNLSRPTIRRTNSFEVHFHVSELKHNLQVELDSLFAVFDSWDDAGSFAVNYRLLAANVPRPIESNLHVIVETRQAAS